MAADPIASRFNKYTAYTIEEKEYIGTIEESIYGVRDYLIDQNYEAQRLSAAKKHHETGQPHELSYRRVPTEHPDETEGKQVETKFEPEQCQFHVHAFAIDDAFELYSHYETRPDFLSPSLELNRLQTHYRPDHGETYLLGVADLDI